MTTAVQEVRQSAKPVDAPKRGARLAAVSESLRQVLVSAYFWYALLAVFGTLTIASGVAAQFGIGYGLIAFGVLCILGSEVIRGGMIRG